MIPTAEEFKHEFSKSIPFGEELMHFRASKEVSKAMIEFAKLHVEAALIQSSEKAEVNMWVGLNKDEEQFEELKDLDSLHLEVDAQSILNAYLLENIK